MRTAPEKGAQRKITGEDTKVEDSWDVFPFSGSGLQLGPCSWDKAAF